MLRSEVLMGSLGLLNMATGVTVKMKEAKQIPHIAFCHECIWWQSEGDGRYGYCSFSGKKVPADKMASACRGAKPKSQQPIKHTQKDTKTSTMTYVAMRDVTIKCRSATANPTAVAGNTLLLSSFL